MLGSRLLPAAGLALAGALACLAHAPAPDVALREAPAHEGQGAVRIEGTVVRIQPGAGTVWLAQDGARLAVHTEAGESAPALGSNATATGRLVRVGGELTLWAGAFEATQPEGLPEPGWDLLAASPEAWSDRTILLAGTVQGGALRDQEGHRLHLAGPAPPGPFRGAGLLRYTAACLCYGFTPTP